MSDLILLTGEEVRNTLLGCEREAISLVRAAYEAHLIGDSALPQSSFLRFPHDHRSRIIALPAMLGGEAPTAGMKWISSFPGNIERGLERASAVIILNSMETGLPVAMIEGSIISAQRTAASAALAAEHLCAGMEPVLGLVGGGRINFEVVRFIRTVRQIQTVLLYDLDVERSRAFARKCDLPVKIADTLDDVLGGATLVSFATTASTPYIASLDQCPAGVTLLNLSLRDFSPAAVLQADNIVDDLEHVCRENTSIDLCARSTGNRNFVRCTLADVTSKKCVPRRDETSPVLFSPFGLGILDLALARFVVDRASKLGLGMRVSNFQPNAWLHSEPGTTA